MAAYPRMDAYQRSRYEQGIDAKVVVMGNTGVGKTSLLQRYTQNKFDPKNTTSTTGAFFVTKKVYVNGVKVRLQLWDTAGQERFRSMAPMYYRGANAALLLYDITSLASFEDVKGWLQELKKNCANDLIIYIVGSKADLHHSRQVTSDLARLSLQRWFPPPRPPTPPPPPSPPTTFSYIRPRFTSFTSMRSAPLATPVSSPQPPRQSPPESNSSAEGSAPLSGTSPGAANAFNRAVALRRANTGTGHASGAKSTSALLNRTKSTNGVPITRTGRAIDGNGVVSNGRAYGGAESGYAELDSQSVMIEYGDDESDDREWGLEKGMELFEVSAKDDTGIQALFQSLIGAIVEKKDAIEQENELKKRDSVFLSNPPAWDAQAEEEEAREKAESSRSGAWSCCQT